VTPVPTPAWVVERFAARREIPETCEMPADTADERGDHALNPSIAPLQPLKPAAVLVPLVDRPEGLAVLLTQRTAHLAHHAGQISFPGGHIEPDDGGPLETALRETEEEVGLDRRHVSVIGHLDTYVTRTGFVVTPVVGIVDPSFEVAPDPHEVAEVFEVPLAFFLDPANHQRHSAEFNGIVHHFHAMPYGRHYVWGATAGMLLNLYQVLSRE